jgi:hypothetical protein
VTREDADELWGREAVERALAEPDPEPLTDELLDDFKKRATSLSPGAFRSWALALPWKRFCLLVRVVSGTLREELLADDE